MTGERPEGLPDSVVHFAAATDGSCAEAVVLLGTGQTAEEPAAETPVAGGLTYGGGIPIGQEPTDAQSRFMECMPPAM